MGPDNVRLWRKLCLVHIMENCLMVNKDKWKIRKWNANEPNQINSLKQLNNNNNANNNGNSATLVVVVKKSSGNG